MVPASGTPWSSHFPARPLLGSSLWSHSSTISLQWNCRSPAYKQSADVQARTAESPGAQGHRERPSADRRRELSPRGLPRNALAVLSTRAVRQPSPSPPRPHLPRSRRAGPGRPPRSPSAGPATSPAGLQGRLERCLQPTTWRAHAQVSSTARSAACSSARRTPNGPGFWRLLDAQEWAPPGPASRLMNTLQSPL